MTASPASVDSDYGSELDWDDAAESQLAAIELNASSAGPTSSSNHADNSTASAGAAVVDVPDGAVETTEKPALTAARLAVALREFGVAVERDERSLWERFRQRRDWGALSVSDLSGPSWCEVQHSYRLASKPYLPPLERPATIISASGASIAVDTSRTVKREAVLDKGKAVHSKIEREVMGPQEKVEVEIAGKEEWWALRIVNTLVCLETLLETGRVREVPVVGWIRGFLVFGVIDEIERRKLPVSPPAPTPSSAVLSSAEAVESSSVDSASSAKPPKPSTATPKRKDKVPPSAPEKDTQRSLKDFFPSVSSPSKKGKQKAFDQDATLDLTMRDEERTAPVADEPNAAEEEIRSRVGFVLSDTKTRFNRSLPAKPESRAARLQLMLYRRLFTSLHQPEPPPPCSSSSPPQPASPSASTSSPFSWTRLYSHLSLDPTLPLSSAFLRSIEPILAGSNLESSLGEAKTLGAFVDVLGRYGEMMRGEREPERLLEEEMEISYRLREWGGGGWKGRRSARRTARNCRERDSQQRSKEEQAQTGEAMEAAVEDEERDLQRAIQLSLQDEAEAMKQDDPVADLPQSASPAVTAPSPVEEEADAIDSQLEDSQLPFLANPSLPLPLADFPPSTEPEALPPPSLPSTAQAFDLPLNSQGSPPAAPPPAAGSSRSTRYNFRRRPAPSSPEATKSTPLQANGNGEAGAPSPPRKRARSASPAAPNEVDVPRAVPPPALISNNFSRSSSSPAPTPTSTSSSVPDADPSFIGTETFQNDPAELDAWLKSVTAYWRGEREPVGVAVTEVNRCRTCEFEDGCEWRAMKAQEAVEQARARRMQGNKAG